MSQAYTQTRGCHKQWPCVCVRNAHGSRAQPTQFHSIYITKYLSPTTLERQGISLMCQRTRCRRRRRRSSTTTIIAVSTVSCAIVVTRTGTSTAAVSSIGIHGIGGGVTSIRCVGAVRACCCVRAVTACCRVASVRVGGTSSAITNVATIACVRCVCAIID